MTAYSHNIVFTVHVDHAYNCSANFICMFKMDYYPFDIQVCEVS
jgi:hypothetical protein